MSKFLTKILLLTAGIISVMALTGCWDDAEINGRAFVLGFGADRAEDTYHFTFQLAIPVSGESDSSGSIQYTSHTVDEATPAAAVRQLEKDLGRQINFEQLSLIVIGDELSNSNFTELTDYFFRRASVRRQSCVAVCSGSAKDFFAPTDTGRAIATEAASILQSYDPDGSISMDLFSLYKALINRDEFFLPRISASASNNSGGKKSGISLTLSGASAYGRDGGYRGEIDEDELELLRLTCSPVTDGALAVYDGSGTKYCCQIKQSERSVKCGISEETPDFVLKLELVLIPLDTGGLDRWGYSVEEVRLISEYAERTVKKRLEALADRSRKELGSSVLGLQDIIRQRQPDWYGKHESHWEEIYQNSKISITVSCTAAGGGITK